MVKRQLDLYLSISEPATDRRATRWRGSTTLTIEDPDPELPPTDPEIPPPAQPDRSTPQPGDPPNLPPIVTDPPVSNPVPSPSMPPEPL